MHEFKKQKNKKNKNSLNKLYKYMQRIDSRSTKHIGPTKLIADLTSKVRGVHYVMQTLA